VSKTSSIPSTSPFPRTRTSVLRVMTTALALAACGEPDSPPGTVPLDETFFQVPLDESLAASPPTWFDGAVEWEYVGQAVYVRAADRDVPASGQAQAPAPDVETDTLSRIRGTLREDSHGRLFRVKSVDERKLRAAVARYDERVVAAFGPEPTASDAEVTSVDEFAAGTATREVHAWSSGIGGSHLWDGESRKEAVSLNAPQRKTVVYYFGDAGLDGSMCSGSLIDDSFVLTAAHCVKNSDASAWIYAEDSNPSDGKTESKRGKVCTRGNNLSGAKCANVTDRWISPDYTGDGDFGDDIAVMKIDQPLGQANWIAMSSASNSVIDDYAMYNIGHPGTSPTGANNVFGCSLGFGASVGGFTSDALAPCRSRMYWDSGAVSYTTSKILGGHFDSSPGHSGGPLFYYPGGGTAHYQSAVLDGYTDGVFENFNGGARVPYHRDWIINMVDNH